MPVILDSIDAISRRKGRDVLMLGFAAGSVLAKSGQGLNRNQSRRRRLVMDWLDTQRIPYERCFSYWSDGLICASYQGHLYLDVPPDPADELYQRLLAKLEYPDGSPRLSGVQFWLVPLKVALRNAHHDTAEFGEGLAG